MMVVFWSITPLQSAVIATKVQSRHISVPVISSSPLLNPVDPYLAINSNIFISAYGVIWLGSQLPSFVTQNFALQPVELDDSYKSVGVTWEVPTISYSSDLNCSAARSDQYTDPMGNRYYRFQNDQGCQEVITDQLLRLQSGGQYYVNLIPFENFDTTKSNCTGSSMPTFLSVWGEIHNSTNHPSALELRNISASFCQSNYYSQNVLASVTGSNFSVLDSLPVSAKVPLSSTMFNFTLFDTLFLQGAAYEHTPSDQADDIVVDTSYGIPSDANRYVTVPVGLAFGLSKLSADQFYMSDLRNGAFDSVHRFLFSLAINRLQAPPRPAPSTLDGTVIMHLDTIFVVRIFAIIVECFLAVVGVCSILLLILFRRRRSEMVDDPASIENIAVLLAADRTTLDDFINLDTANTRQLEADLQSKIYKLHTESTSRSPSREASSSIIKASGKPRLQKAASTPSNRTKQGPVATISTIPFQMSLPFAFTFIAIIALAIILLAVLYQHTITSNGKAIYFECPILHPQSSPLFQYTLAIKLN